MAAGPSVFYAPTPRQMNIMNHLTIKHSATRVAAIMILALSLLPTGGCRICADCEDLAYPAYGGAWQRTRRNEGRVGSIFDPAGAKASELVDRDAPEKPDALERARQGLKDDTDEQDAETEPESSDQADEVERDMEEKANELRELDLDDINVVPGGQAPPSLN